MVGIAFDYLAARYDALWSDTAIGRQQREAVWRRIDPLFEPGHQILDLGCGTGSDAAHLMARGIRVRAIDASEEMARIARAQGVNAYQMPIESIVELPYRFDGAISNFGPFNCVSELQPVAQALGRLIRSGGYLVLCLMGPVCAWEIAHYLRRLEPGKAFRRWKRSGTMTSLGVRVTYPSRRRLMRLFRPDFELVDWAGIGLFVPPSYINRLSDAAILKFAALDRRVAHLPGLRALSDHRLFVFQRL